MQREKLKAYSGIMKEIYNLHQRLFCLVLSCYVLEGNACLLLYINLGVALTYAKWSAAFSHSSFVGSR